VEQDVTASPPQGSRHKIYSPHATHILDDDKEDTRAAETWLAERCTLPRKISADFHEYTHTSLKVATEALGNTFSRIHRGFIHSCSNIGAKSNARSANAAYIGRIEE
jgi:hypothetical protein